MDEKKCESIALFRYGIIAPVLHESIRSQASYFRDMAEKQFDVPGIGLKKYKVSAFKTWLFKYKKGGIDLLKPKQRIDKCKSRKITPEIGNMISAKVSDYPNLSCSSIYRILVSEGAINPDFTEQTVRKYIKDNNLKTIEHEAIPRKKFEKEAVNMLWISDFMHGPHIPCEGKKKKVYLCCIIDDHSRVIVSGGFFHHENTQSLEAVLKEGILRFGLPKIFYCDNGAVYSTTHLQLVCARLGISLVHSRPYDSPSRGKIERYWRTVREKFIPLLNLQEINDIKDLNNLFSIWLDKEYNKAYHSGIDAKPFDKYIASLNNVEINRIAKEELDTAFLVTVKRKVKNDSTVSIFGILYEVPPKYIGKMIELRYQESNPDEINIYENNLPVQKINKVNVFENANFVTHGIKFDVMEGENE